jgi:hypothetical protein
MLSLLYVMAVIHIFSPLFTARRRFLPDRIDKPPFPFPDHYNANKKKAINNVA